MVYEKEELKYIKPDTKLDFEMFFGKLIKIVDIDGDIHQGYLMPAVFTNDGNGLELLIPNDSGNIIFPYKSHIKEIILPGKEHIKIKYFNDFRKWNLINKRE